ncbi:hypothetical protein ACFFSY_25140 [Paenibacillus aurantiacus]|uniref:Uncharacterized protein n=1 Tax=Paenibacillus aurantiacus TaxID=1936118 RepID=A0ABV5KWE7_9BACL
MGTRASRDETNRRRILALLQTMARGEQGRLPGTFSGKLYDEFIAVEDRSITLKYDFHREEAFVLCSVNVS